MSKFLKTIDSCDGFHLQINEYLFVAIQGVWFLQSVCKRNLAFEIDV